MSIEELHQRYEETSVEIARLQELRRELADAIVQTSFKLYPGRTVLDCNGAKYLLTDYGLKGEQSGRPKIRGAIRFHVQ